jgi:rfaE bifunctional protein nucleotidyltransferase chain/domain
MNKLEKIKSKILTLDEIVPKTVTARLKERRIVFTNGCFDILHRGHFEYLAKAASYGDVMIVGVNTDKSVKLLKGDNRPINDERSRAISLASLHVVNYVVLFNEETPGHLIEMVKPDVLVKGGEYKPDEIVGYDVVNHNGGEIITIEMVDGFSTTNLINKVKTHL